MRTVRPFSAPPPGQDGRRRVLGHRLLNPLVVAALLLALLVAPRSHGVVAGATAAGPAASRFSQDRDPLRVLFIGNSYTYYNNLPEMLEQLAAASAADPVVDSHMVVEGGATLQDHWEGGAATAALEQQDWHYVVIQEQSTLGRTYLVEGKDRVMASDDFARHARLWSGAIARSGAQGVLFAHWKRAVAPARDQMALDAAFADAVRTNDLTPAPIGRAWNDVASSHPDIELYAADGSHPSTAGSYLAAVTLYATLFGRSPVGLPGRVSGHPADEDSGTVDESAEAVLVDLDADDAAVLQRAAWRAVQAIRASEASLGPEAAPPIELPELPEGRPFGVADLVGAWEGEARHYPDYLPWPATMRLRVAAEGADLSARLTLSFGGRPDDIVRSVEIRRSDDRFEFVDVEGPNGGIVRYRGVLEAADELAGIAEILVEGAPIYAIGSWHLRRTDR